MIFEFMKTIPNDGWKELENGDIELSDKTVIKKSVFDKWKSDNALELELNKAKEAKKSEIKSRKKQAQIVPVEVRGVMFYGGRDAGQKYDESLRLAQKMNAIQGSGLVKGIFWDANDNPVEVDEAYANEVIISVAGAVYALAEREKLLVTKINNATTVAEVENIVWSNL